MKNTCGDKTLLGVVNVHSNIDLITNSSTEIFCVVEGNDKDNLQEILNNILEDLGCKCCGGEDGLYIEPHNYWDEENNKEVYPEGQFAIWYENYAPPCKMILEKIKETFSVIKHYG